MLPRSRFGGVLGPGAATHLDSFAGQVVRRYVSGDGCAAIAYERNPGARQAAFATGCDGLVTLAADARLYNPREILATLGGRRRAMDDETSEASLLLALYLEFGPAFAIHARGMFTVAVWDSRDGTLVVSRDAVGARPFYYAPTPTHLAFSSTLRSLRRWPGVSLKINLDAVRRYLTYAFVPGEATLLEGVFELLPGHALVARHLGSAGIRVEKCSYWKPEEVPWDDRAPIEEYSRPLRALLEDAVRERCPARGPVAVLLSGGLDSSAVTALASKLHAPVHTYSISFGAEYPSELEFSGMVAAHCGTNHHVLEVSGGRVGGLLEETVALLDDPVGDPLTVPNYLLDEAAGEVSDVILNGEGGDPCFGGPKNLPMLLHELYAPSGEPLAAERAYLRSYRKCYDDLPALLTPGVQAALARLPPQETFLAPYFDERSGMREYLNRLMLINVRLKGAHHILAKVDRMTAAHGVEGRSPLFDRRVVEYSFRVPPKWKLAGPTEKLVLKRAVDDLLPRAIVDRPKSGMLVPVQAWFRGPLRGLARGALLSKRARDRGILNQGLVKQWLDYSEGVFPRQGAKLWLVLTLELWFRSYVDAAR